MEDPEHGRREEILEAVVRLVDSEGPDSLTIRGVAETVGVSTGLILYYFKTKRELLSASWSLAVQRYSQQVSEMAQGARGLARLRAHFLGCFLDPEERLLPWSYWLQYWSTAARDEEIRHFNLENYERIRSSLEGHIHEAIQDGSLPSDIDPLLAADLLKTLDYGLTVQLALDREVIPPERAIQIADLVLSLMSADTYVAGRSDGTGRRSRSHSA